MPTVEEVTDPHVHTYTAPPQWRVGVCRICHSWTEIASDGSRYDVCESCRRTIQGVTRPLRLVVPFSLDVVTEQLHSVLWGYWAWDVVTIVPSSGDRAGTHPLETAVKMGRAQRGLYSPLLERTEVELDHRHADESAYRVTREVNGRGILLMDDTFTTGARIQSAASALSLAGADVVAGVVVGRVVRPDYAPEAQALWDEQRALRFDFGQCCLGEEAFS